MASVACSDEGDLPSPPWLRNGAPPLIFIEGSHPSLAGKRAYPTLNRHWEPMESCHVEEVSWWGPWAVGRPWAGPTGLPLWPTDCPVGPLAPGCWHGLIQVSLLLWWALQSMYAPVAVSDWTTSCSLAKKGYDCPSFPVRTCTHRNPEGHVEFGDLLAT